MDRRADYSWPKTSLANLSVVPDKGTVSRDEDVGITVGFRVVGGSENSHPQRLDDGVGEDNDKLVRLMMETSVSAGRRKIATTGKEVRRARFYW